MKADQTAANRTLPGHHHQLLRPKTTTTTVSTRIIGARDQCAKRAVAVDRSSTGSRRSSSTTSSRIGLPQRLSTFSRIPLLLLLLLLLLPRIEATVVVGNRSYPSLPGLFGRFMQEGEIYHGRLQFLPENPYLCDPYNPNHTSYVIPAATTIPTADGTNVTIHDAVVLLAVRGNCPFQRKATVAESVDRAVMYLVVYNYNLEGEETLVPMYSEFGNTRLYLLSITHKAGKEMRQALLEQPNSVHKNGGPFIQMDAQPPAGITADDLQQMMLSALGLFFMLVSFSGCLMILLGTYGQLQEQHHQQQLQYAAGGAGTPASILATLNNSNNSLGGPFPRTFRSLLTMEEVQRLSNLPLANTAMATTTTARLSLQQNDPDDDNNNHNHHNSQPAAAGVQTVLAASSTASAATAAADTDSSHTCAICIDDFHARSVTTTLPCGHVFHTDCIGPWLTERQSKCPLCKFDVLLYLMDFDQQQQQQQQSNNNNNHHGMGDPNDDADGGGAGRYAWRGWLTTLVQQHRRQYSNWMRVDQRAEHEEEEEEEEAHDDDDHNSGGGDNNPAAPPSSSASAATNTTTTTTNITSHSRRTRIRNDPGEVEMTQ